MQENEFSVLINPQNQSTDLQVLSQSRTNMGPGISTASTIPSQTNHSEIQRIPSGGKDSIPITDSQSFFNQWQIMEQDQLLIPHQFLSIARGWPLEKKIELVQHRDFEKIILCHNGSYPIVFKLCMDILNELIETKKIASIRNLLFTLFLHPLIQLSEENEIESLGLLRRSLSAITKYIVVIKEIKNSHPEKVAFLANQLQSFMVEVTKLALLLTEESDNNILNWLHPSITQRLRTAIAAIFLIFSRKERGDNQSQQHNSSQTEIASSLFSDWESQIPWLFNLISGSFFDREIIDWDKVTEISKKTSDQQQDDQQAKHSEPQQLQSSDLPERAEVEFGNNNENWQIQDSPFSRN